MKIIVVGGTGTIGKAVVAELAKRHTVIAAGYTQGDVKVDMKDIKSVENMYKSIGQFDAVVSTVGKVHFGDFAEMTPDQYFIGLNDKLMGQVNLVLAGLPFIADKGSFTLTSGILDADPIRYGSSASMVNGAINSFVNAASIEMPRAIRINSISPTIVTESMGIYGDYFKGFGSAPVARVALAYSKSVEGLQTGQTYKIW